MLKKGCAVLVLGFVVLIVAFAMDPNKPRTRAEICREAHEISEATGGRVTPQKAAETVCDR